MEKEANKVLDNFHKKLENRKTFCNLYMFLRNEMVSRLNMNFGLMTVTLAFIGSVFAFIGTTRIYDFGLVGCFGILAIQFIYLEYMTRIKDLSLYLLKLEKKLKGTGVSLPDGGWQHHIAEVYYFGGVAKDKDKPFFISFTRFKWHYVSLGLLILFFGAYTVLNFISFTNNENCDGHLFLNYIPSNWNLFYIQLLIEIIGISLFIMFIIIYRKTSQSYVEFINK